MIIFARPFQHSGMNFVRIGRITAFLPRFEPFLILLPVKCRDNGMNVVFYKSVFLIFGTVVKIAAPDEPVGFCQILPLHKKEVNQPLIEQAVDNDLIQRLERHIDKVAVENVFPPPQRKLSLGIHDVREDETMFRCVEIVTDEIDDSDTVEPVVHDMNVFVGGNVEHLLIAEVEPL